MPPAGPAADRNLLFGILAVQMDFVSRDDLIAAMNAWVLAKHRSLGEILVEQGALPTDLHDHLEILVNRHVQMHGGEAAQSLAALSSAGSAREALQKVADPDVQASLVQIPGTLNTGGDPFRTTAPEQGTRPRFRILRPHAKGGLGEVFVAHDEELNRPVALKEIQARHAGNRDSRGRFLLEAEITGRLEHPGIVPVCGSGSYADGRPYYAMRFIEGEDLRDAIERFHAGEKPGRDPGDRRLAFRELLGRFVDVCNAVAFAHSRGVLHRDLKPGNVMLGKYGETLVVDWGLAKAAGRKDEATPSEASLIQPRSGSQVTPTQAGSALGTPAYMSPEQAAGQLDRLGPASDVYSLGATLYTLLTGKAPVVGSNVGEVLRKVQRGEVVPLRQVKFGTPPALEAICSKAMALRPEDRYGSALEMAVDVEQWLADEPVTAYQEPLSTRLLRWGRRHRPLVAAGAALLATAVMALTVSTALIEHQKALTEEALNREADAHRQTGEALVTLFEREMRVRKTNTKLEETLAQSLLRPLRDEEGDLANPEIEALWELTASTHRIRLEFVKRALRRKESRFDRHHFNNCLRFLASVRNATRTYEGATKRCAPCAVCRSRKAQSAPHSSSLPGTARSGELPSSFYRRRLHPRPPTVRLADDEDLLFRLVPDLVDLHAPQLLEGLQEWVELGPILARHRVEEGVEGHGFDRALGPRLFPHFGVGQRPGRPGERLQRGLALADPHQPFDGVPQFLDGRGIRFRHGAYSSLVRANFIPACHAACGSSRRLPPP
jgi:serine/threonine protein kinase